MIKRSEIKETLAEGSHRRSDGLLEPGFGLARTTQRTSQVPISFSWLHSIRPQLSSNSLAVCDCLDRVLKILERWEQEKNPKEGSGS